MEASPKNHQKCPNCGGTGDLAAFHGESRFLLTHEECPFCCGFGHVLEEEQQPAEKKKEKKRE